MAQIRIIADRTLCIGAGQCVMVAPDLFTQDEDEGLVVVRIDAVAGEVLREAEFAVTSCPTRALSLKADDA